MLVRSVMTWTIYGIIPALGGSLIREISDDQEWPDTISHGLTFIGAIAHTIAFALGFAALVFLSRLWRDTVDVACVKFSQWMEDLVHGKTMLSGSLGPIKIDFVDTKIPFANRHVNGYGGKHSEKV